CSSLSCAGADHRRHKVNAQNRMRAIACALWNTRDKMTRKPAKLRIDRRNYGRTYDGLERPVAMDLDSARHRRRSRDVPSVGAGVEMARADARADGNRAQPHGAVDRNGGGDDRMGDRGSDRIPVPADDAAAASDRNLLSGRVHDRDELQATALQSPNGSARDRVARHPPPSGQRRAALAVHSGFSLQGSRAPALSWS